jgi:hypothetical protein
MVSWRSILVLAAVAVVLAGPCAAQDVTGTYYFADTPFPEFMPLWQEGWRFKDADGEQLIYARLDMPLGGYLFVYYRNTGKDPMKITDLTMDGIKMSEALGKSDEQKKPEERYAASLLLSKLPKDQIEKLQTAGGPVWWKADPIEVQPGGVGEIVVRMKRAPKVDKIDIGVIGDTGTVNAQVLTKKAQPRFATIGFATDMKTVNLYARRAAGQTSVPNKVFIDGKDVTAYAKIGTDKSLDTSAIVLSLPEPLEFMSYHVYRAEYSDGSAATAGIRAWGHEMVYGMWSSPGLSGDPAQALKTVLADYQRHNVNSVMPFVVGAEGSYFNSEPGWDYCQSVGMDRMLMWPTPKRTAVFLFAMDEPDASDASSDCFPVTERLGGLGQFLVGWSDILRARGHDSPILLNVDNTYKPENWYIYHQLPDIPCVDPYFPEQQDLTYSTHPGYLSAHTKPTYVYGVSTISQSSGQPKPLHVILCSTQYRNDKGYSGRFPTPEEKRMEVYYTVAAGAKGISYWWFNPGGGCNGVGSDWPSAKALWKEIGLLGAEVRTAGPVITTSCPAELPIKAPRLLWVRSLLSGRDTVAIIAVNDDVLCDRVGTVVKPIENANLSVGLPSWVEPKDAFEVTCDGMKDVTWKRDGAKAAVELGTVNVSRFVIITADASLRARLQKRYDDQFAANVMTLKGG